ncbi:sphingolipid delta(4)-desaturase [Diutina catenulata]
MSTIKHRTNNQDYPVEAPPADVPLEVLNEFYWTTEKEAHGKRRQLILKKYPEVKKLTGYEPKTKWWVLAVVATQFACAFWLRNTPVLSTKFLLTAYVIGATANQAIFLAIHELSHNLLFKKPLHNKLFAIFTNMPIGIPYSASFQPYHQLHHKFLGDENLDTDLPTRFEAMVLSNPLGKLFFAIFQIFFYALRPMFVTQINMTKYHALNVVWIAIVDSLMVRAWGGNALWYFIVSSFLAGSLHPCAGHFIAEHYVLNEHNKPRTVMVNGSNVDLPPLETYSYYGVLNLVTWNVGYHNEHHDFPYVAWTKLPELRRIASDFYDPLPQVSSWTGVLWWFCVSDINTLWNRVKRTGNVTSGRKVGGLDEN